MKTFNPFCAHTFLTFSELLTFKHRVIKTVSLAEHVFYNNKSVTYTSFNPAYDVWDKINDAPCCVL